MGRPFHPTPEALPPTLAIFPLPGVLLLPDGKLQYSIQSRISWGEPVPTLAAIYGWAPIRRQKAMNSCVPKLLSSIYPPQLTLTCFGRLEAGPMPSRQ